MVASCCHWSPAATNYGISVLLQVSHCCTLGWSHTYHDALFLLIWVALCFLRSPIAIYRTFCHSKCFTVTHRSGFVLFLVFHCHSMGTSASSQVLYFHWLAWLHVIPDSYHPSLGWFCIFPIVPLLLPGWLCILGIQPLVSWMVKLHPRCPTVHLRRGFASSKWPTVAHCGGSELSHVPRFLSL